MRPPHPALSPSAVLHSAARAQHNIAPCLSQVTQASISQARRKVKLLKQAREQLAKRQERADIMLEATLHITAAMHVPEHADTPPFFREVPVQPAVQPIGRRRCQPHQGSMSAPILPSQICRAPGLTPPPLAAFHAHLPLSYYSVLQHSGAESAPPFTTHPACTTLHNCSVAGGMRGKCQQFRAHQAAQHNVHYSEVAWFPQMQTEVEAGMPLGFSSTLSSPQCAASFVLACLASSVEEALCATLQDQQANATSSGVHTSLPGPPVRMLLSLSATLASYVPGPYRGSTLDVTGYLEAASVSP